MKSKSLIVANVLIFAVGLIICLMHARENIIHNLLFVTGLIFLVPGVANLLILIDRRNKPAEEKTSGFRTMISWVSTAAAIILGAMIVITPDSFKAEFMFIIGALLILLAITLFYIMAVNLKEVKLPVWMYAGPGLVLVDGVVIACMKSTVSHNNLVAFLMGFGLMLVAISFFMAFFAANSHNRAQRKAEAAQAKPASTSAVARPNSEPEDAVILSEDNDK